MARPALRVLIPLHALTLAALLLSVGAGAEQGAPRCIPMSGVINIVPDGQASKERTIDAGVGSEMITGFLPRTHEIVLSGRTGRTERIKVRSIALEGPRQLPTAQSEPANKSLGKISQNFRIDQVSIQDGVLRTPGCVPSQPGREVFFVGAIAFNEDMASLEGEFFGRGGGGGGIFDILRTK